MTIQLLKSVLVWKFLEKKKLVQLTHLLYSPVLSTCEFPLLTKLQIIVEKFSRNSAFVSVLFQSLHGVPIDAFFSALTFVDFKSRKCISVKSKSKRYTTAYHNAVRRTTMTNLNERPLSLYIWINEPWTINVISTI